MKLLQLAGTFLIGMATISMLASCSSGSNKADAQTRGVGSVSVTDSSNTDSVATTRTPIDTAQFRQQLTKIANGDTTGRWPVKNQPIPLPGAILPFKRIVVYYGNLHSKKMGALGEYPPKEMWSRLNAEVKRWEKADPTTPVQAGVHYIAAVASGTPGKDGMYINRMPDKQIDSVLKIAKMHNGIVFLDIQVALSNIR